MKNTLPNTDTEKSIQELYSENPNLVTIQKAAKALKVSKDTLRRWEAKGKIFSIRTTSGYRLYDLKNLIKAAKAKPEIETPKAQYQSHPQITLPVTAQTPLGSGSTPDHSFYSFSNLNPDIVKLPSKQNETFSVPVKKVYDYSKFSQVQGSSKKSPFGVKHNLRFYTAALVLAIILFTLLSVASVYLPVFNQTRPAKFIAGVFQKSPKDIKPSQEVALSNSKPEVLAVSSIAKEGKFLQLNLDTNIVGNLAVEGEGVFTENLTAPNILYSLVAGNNISITGDAQNPTISTDLTLEDATTTTKGIASFSADFFTVTAGAVSLTDGSITNTQIKDGTVSNTDLTNPSITINTAGSLTGGGSVSLGGSITLTGAASGVTSITGTSNQVIASDSTGAITLSLPQDIATTSSPTFASLLVTGSTSGTLTLNTAAITTSYTLTLPADDGTSGYVLQTDGSGNTSWVAQSGGGTSLQGAYDGGNTITTSTGRNIAFTLASGLATSTSFSLTNAGTANAFVLNDTNVASNISLDIQSGGTTSLSITEAGILSTSGNISTTGTGAITSAGTLTASNGFTQTTGALSQIATSGSISATGLTALTYTLSSGTAAITAPTLNLNTASTGNTAIGNTTGTFALTSNGGLNVSTGGALTGVASIDTIGVNATSLTFAGAGTISSTTIAALTLDSGTTGTVNLGTGNNAKTINLGTGTAGNTINIGTNNTVADAINIGSALDTTILAGTVRVSGLSVSSAVYTDGSSNLTSTAPTSGTIGYWSRSGTTLSPATAGDAVTTSGNISTSSTGAITSAGTLTASNGFTMTTGALSLTSTSGAISSTGLTALTYTLSSGTAAITAPALNLNTASTGNTAIGNTTGTFALTSNGGLNVTTGGALTGVASIDTISTSATAITFAGTGTLGATSTALNLQADGAIDVNIAGGSGATGCTIANSTGDLTCTGNITGSGSGTAGFWSRTSTTLSPATANDIVSIANTNTTGADLAVINTGVYTGTGIFNLTANSATTGTVETISATGLTTGKVQSISATNTATTNTAITQALYSLTNAQSTLANSSFVGLGLNFTNNPSIAGNTEYAFQIQNQLTANITDNVVSALLRLDNADTVTTGSTVVTNGLLITNSGGLTGGFTNGVTVGSGTDSITTGLNLASTGITNDISLQNGETIDNDVDGTINLAVTGTSALKVGSTGISSIGNVAHTIVNSSGALAIDSNSTGAINIGTGANAKTITMGNATGATALALTSGTGAQTFTSSVTTGATTASAFVFNASSLSSGTALRVTSTSTSGKLVDLNATNTSGTIFNLAYGTSATLTGDTTGLLVDLNSGTVVATNQNLTGVNFKIPTVTNTVTTGTKTLTGMLVNFGSGAGINQNGAGGTLEYIAGDFQMPALTQTAGTLNAYGTKVTTPATITTGGTAYGHYVNATGVGAGTLSGIGISNITGGSGTEYALNVAGTGWDAVLRVGSTTVINGSGITQVPGGGTGLSTVTQNGVVYGNAASNLGVTAAGTTGQVLIATTGSAPSWGSISGSTCTNCLVTDPAADQTIAPTGQGTTGLSVRQTSTASPTDDIFQVTSSDGATKYFYVDKDGNVSTAGTSAQTLTLTPLTDTTALTLVGTNVTSQPLQYINSKNSSATSGIINMAYGAAQTLSGSVIGFRQDLSTNVTATNQSVTGYQTTLPAATNTNTSGTVAYKGLAISGGALNANGTGGATTYSGLDITIPALTQTLGTLTAYGANITTPSSITTGGTAYGYNVAASGVGAGTLYGLNISDITAGAGTEVGAQIGSGWDTNLLFNDTTTNIAVANGGTITIADSAGNSLCTITDAGTTGNLSCSGTIGGSGTVGFWSKSGTTLSPATANDIVSIANTTTTGADLALTNTGVYTGTGIFNLTANSATTGTIASLSGTGMTTGEILDITGTWAPTDGSTNEAIDINITHAPTSSADVFSAIDLNITDATALANTIYGNQTTIALSSNAAKTAYGVYSSLTGTGTSGDVLYGGFFNSQGGSSAQGTNYGIWAQAGVANTVEVIHAEIDANMDVGVKLGNTGSSLSQSTAIGFQADLSGNTSSNTGANALTRTGFQVSQAAATISSGSNNSTYRGFYQNAAAALTTSSTYSGTVSSYGVDLVLPNITQGAGTINAYGANVTNGTITTAGTQYGVNVSTGSITTAGTQYGLNVAATGVGAGTLYGANISNITGGAGAETALSIGSGWDTDLAFADTSPTVTIGNGGTLSLTDGTNTLCSIADTGTTGNLTCTGNITGASTGTVGYWSRSGTTLSTATAADNVTVDGTLDANGTFTIGDSGDTGAISATTLDIDATGALQINSSGGAISIGNDAVAQSIDIGTGAAARTITIGNSTSTTALAFNSGTGSQTFTSQATTGTTTTSAFVFDATALNSGTGSYFTSDSITTGKLLQVATTGNTLTSGTLTDIRTTSTALTGTAGTGSLINLDWTPGSSTTATGDLFALNIGANGSTTGNLFNILDSGSSIFSVSETSVTTSLPTNFTSPGDVSIAYDLNFTNPVASYIKSYSALTIQPGDPFGSSNLTLSPYNEGSVYIPSNVATAYGLDVDANLLSTGRAVDISSTSTAGGASGASYLLYLDRSGANASATHTAYGLYSTVANTGTTNVNIGVFSQATGAITNYGVQTGAITSASSGTNYQLNLGAIAGAASATSASINTGAISGAGTSSSGITLGANSATATTNSGINIGAISGAGTTNQGLNIGAVSGATNNYEIAFAGTTPEVAVANGGTITISDGTNTLCTIADAGTTGNLTCTGNITGSSSGTAGFWTRTSTTLSPATANDIVSIANTTTSGADLALTNTGVYTGTGIFNLTANSATTGDLMALSGTALTTGSLMTLSGPSGGTAGLTDSLLKLTSDIGNTGVSGGMALLTATIDSTAASANGVNLNVTTTNSNSTNANTAYGIYSQVSDSTSLANTNIGISATASSGGNAAKTLIGVNGVGTSVSTTADNVYGVRALTDISGIITSGTRNVYGVYSLPLEYSASTGGTTNLYGVRSSLYADGAAGSTYNGYSLYVANGTFDTDGTTTQIGLALEPLTGADTNIGICFDCDGTYSSSTVASGIQFGTDANAVTLYRSASDILRTGDGLTVDQDLIVSGGDVTGANDESIDIGEAANGTISLNIDGTSGLNVGSTGISSLGNVAHTIVNSAGALAIDSNSTGAINIGTGANAKTITIGNATGATALAFNSGTGSQTFTSQVVSGTTTTSAFVFDATALTTGTGSYFTSDSITQGKLLQIATTGNTLTTGTLADIRTTATSLTGAAGVGSLMNLDWSPGSSTTATGDLFSLNIGANGTTTGNLFNILDSGSSIFSVSETSLTTSLPSNFTAAGDVSVAYDLNFTNPTASYIKSSAPLYVVAGETFNSSNLTLGTYNQGTIVLQTNNTTTTAVDLTNTTLTTGTGLNASFSALTTGTGLAITSSNASQTSASALSVTQSGVTTGYTGNLVSITGTSTTGAGNLLNIAAANTTAGSALNISSSALTTGTLLNITHTTSGITSGSLIKATAAGTGTVATNGIISFQHSGDFGSTSNMGFVSVQANSTTAGTVASISGTALTTGRLLQLTGGGTYTGSGLVALTANSATSGDLMTISGTGLTSGSALVLTGSSAAPGQTDALLKVSGNVGSMGAGNGLISSSATINTTGASQIGTNLYMLTTNAPTSNSNQGYGIYHQINDATSLANNVIGEYLYMNLSGNAAKTTYGKFADVRNSSNVGNTVYSGRFTVSQSTGTTSGSSALYGVFSSVLNNGITDTNAASTYGGYFTTTGNTGGTNSTSYGVWASASGADLNYPFYSGVAFPTANTAGLCWDNSGESAIYDCNGTPTDLAENYGTSDSSIGAGDVVVMTGQAQEVLDPREGKLTTKAFIAKSTGAYNSQILGVVSTNPNQTYGEDGLFDPSENPRPVSLTGRVPVKVSTENGPIKSGDYLTSSSVPGVAMKSTQPGITIGRALNDYSGSGVGKVVVYVHTGYADPTEALANLLIAENGQLVGSSMNLQNLTVSQNITVGGLVSASDYSLNADKIKQVGVLASLPVDSQNRASVADALNLLTQAQNTQQSRIGDLETREASTAAAIADAQILGEQALDQTASLQESVASTSSTIANLSSQIEELFASITGDSNPSTASNSSLPSSNPEDLALTPPTVMFASDSATLDTLTVNSQATISGQLTAYDGIFQNSLKSLGDTFLGKTNIAGDLSVDGTFSVTEGSKVNALPILYFQTSALAEAVDFFNGLVTITKDGAIAAKEIITEQISVKADSSAGTVVLTAGETEMPVLNELVEDDSIIILTSETTGAPSLAVADKVEDAGFVVKLGAPYSQDIKFSYLIVGQK